MNQTCKVCGEPAAGFHFGAFTCEGCKSFFGRSYNNMSSISECKNNGECVINKKNRTSCKACRLKKCMLVGMSKSGSRYGRRSNWFKIHCLLQEQSQQQQQQAAVNPVGLRVQPRRSPPPTPQQYNFNFLGHNFAHPHFMHLPKTKEELMLLGLDDYKATASPSISSPESHNSDSSVEVSDARKMPVIPALLPPTFLPTPGLFLPPGYPPLYTGLLQPVTNNNNGLIKNYNQIASPDPEAYKRLYLDTVLQSQRTPTPEEILPPTRSEIQTQPIDLSMKSTSERGSSPVDSERSSRSSRGEKGPGSDADEEESECDSEKDVKRTLKPVPLDLTTKV